MTTSSRPSPFSRTTTDRGSASADGVGGDPLGRHRIGIALSLNAPNDEVRAAIMPVNRKWDMAELRETLLAWPRFGGNKVCIEYVLIPGVNDAPQHVAELSEFLAPFKTADNGKPFAVLNLIPYNPRRNSPWPAPDESEVERFLGALIAAGVFAKRRRTKGRTMMGACGQLGSEAIRGRKLVQVGVASSADMGAAAGVAQS